MQQLNLPTQIETERLVLKWHTLDKEYVQVWVDSINQDLEWLKRFFGAGILGVDELSFLW